MSGVMNPFDTLFGVVISRSLVEPDADVAVVRRDVAARLQAAADLDDVGADLLLRRVSSRVGRVLGAARLASRNTRVAPPAASRLSALPGTTKVPHTGSRRILTGGGPAAAAARRPAAPRVALRTTPSIEAPERARDQR